MVSLLFGNRFLFLTSVLGILILAGNVPALAMNSQPDSKPLISRIEVKSSADGDQVILTGNQSFKHSAFLLSDPNRLVLDIPDALLAVDQPNLTEHNTFLKSISTRSVTENDKNLVRIEFVLNDIVPYHITKLDKGLEITFGKIVEGTTIESADAHSMTESLPTEAETDAGEIPSQESAASEAKKVYGISPVTTYKGKPIFLDLKDADILDIFRLIAEVSGFNVVVDPDVSGRITIRMDNVPWDQVLEVILKNQGLGKEIEGNVMRIAHNKKLRDENVLKQQLEFAKRHALPLETVILYLSYADINAMEDSVRGLLSDRGSIMKDERVNAMIIRDIRSNLDQVQNLIKVLDVRTRQVALNSQIVTTTKSFNRALGIAWGGTFVADAAHGNSTRYRFPNSIAIAADTSPGSGDNFHPGYEADPATGSGNSGYAVNLPAGNTMVAFTFGNITDTLKLNLALSAAESDGISKTIAYPTIITANNEAANINSGTKIPYYNNTGNQGARTEWIDATTRLSVTPHITNDNWVKMDIQINRDSPIFSPDGILIATNSADAKVLVKDGDTLVIGGLNETTTGHASEKIPFLNKIPILGYLFKNSKKSNSFNDLLFFITPQILEEGEQVVRSETF